MPHSCGGRPKNVGTGLGNGIKFTPYLVSWREESACKQISPLLRHASSERARGEGLTWVSFGITTRSSAYGKCGAARREPGRDSVAHTVLQIGVGGVCLPGLKPRPAAVGLHARLNCRQALGGQSSWRRRIDCGVYAVHPEDGLSDGAAGTAGDDHIAAAGRDGAGDAMRSGVRIAPGRRRTVLTQAPSS